MPRLGAFLIVKNEERDIEACLESLKGFVDEIVVVDGFSTDRTFNICKRYTAKIFQREWDGFGPQKQFALSQMSSDWVLNVDADEHVSPELAREISEVLKVPTDVSGFWIPFQVFFLGRRLRFGGCGGEKHVRLFRRDKARYDNRLVHEGITVEGSLGQLKNPIFHYSYRDINEYLEKCNRYTSLIARKKQESGEKFRVWHHLRLPWEFFVRYGILGGFLDGTPGLIYAGLSAYYAWMKHLKLRDLQRLSKGG